MMKLFTKSIFLATVAAVEISLYERPGVSIKIFELPFSVLYDLAQNSFLSFPGNPTAIIGGKNTPDIVVPPPRDKYIWDLTAYFEVDTTGSYEFLIRNSGLTTMQIGAGRMCYEDISESITEKHHLMDETPLKVKLEAGNYYPIKIVHFSEIMDLSLLLKVPGSQEYQSLEAEVFDIERGSNAMGQRSKRGEDTEIRGCQPVNVDQIGFSLGAYIYDKEEGLNDTAYFLNGYEKLRKVIDRPVDDHDGRIRTRKVYPESIVELSGHLTYPSEGVYQVAISVSQFVSVQIGPGFSSPQPRYEIDDDWIFVDTRDFQKRLFKLKHDLVYPFRIVYLRGKTAGDLDLDVTNSNGDQVDLFGLWQNYHYAEIHTIDEEISTTSDIISDLGLEATIPFESPSKVLSDFSEPSLSSYEFKGSSGKAISSEFASMRSSGRSISSEFAATKISQGTEESQEIAIPSNTKNSPISHTALETKIHSKKRNILQEPSTPVRISRAESIVSAEEATIEGLRLATNNSIQNSLRFPLYANDSTTPNFKAGYSEDARESEESSCAGRAQTSDLDGNGCFASSSRVCDYEKERLSGSCLRIKPEPINNYPAIKPESSLEQKGLTLSEGHSQMKPEKGTEGRDIKPFVSVSLKGKIKSKMDSFKSFLSHLKSTNENHGDNHYQKNEGKDPTKGPISERVMAEEKQDYLTQKNDQGRMSFAQDKAAEDEEFSKAQSPTTSTKGVYSSPKADLFMTFEGHGSSTKSRLLFVLGCILLALI
ncbi:hypothetical protein JCM33374_g3800 [Metschnikowia sp. JCM 33374]|nr:hypothetical protein JCM33374_g3800 [Metschnikowia sp. JCM 33374]